jgi:predicted small metal-binding protein
MSFKLECRDYGFECEFAVQGEKKLSTLEKLREHFEAEHGIDYSSEFLIQMVINKGYSRESILNE